MRNRAAETAKDWGRVFLTAGVAALSVLFVLAALTASVWAQAPTSQSPTVPQWQVDAGGKMEFDAASIKPNISSDPPHTNVGLSNLDEGPPNGGLLSAVKFSLTSYIGFAYKLAPSQLRLLATQLPKWAASERFDIQARADGKPTRDQMRLMMQSLLVDRFKLAVHFEARQLPMFALVLEKPGKTGPQLAPDSDDPPCAASSTSSPAPGAAPAPPAKDSSWFAPCGGVGALFVSGRWRVGSRNLTMGQVASILSGASMGALDRPVFDQTGLSGGFDFKIEFTPEPNGPVPPNSQPDPSGPTFLEALKEQLGLKLVPQTGPVDVLVIDHVEQPSEN